MDMLKKTYETLHVKESEKIKSVAYSTSAKENNRPQSGRERKMYRVYSRYVKTGKINYLNVFDSELDAINHIAKCYRIDKELGQLGEYYYFVK